MGTRFVVLVRAGSQLPSYTANVSGRTNAQLGARCVDPPNKFPLRRTAGIGTRVGVVVVDCMLAIWILVDVVSLFS